MELLTRNNFEGWMQKLMERLDRQDELLVFLLAIWYDMTVHPLFTVDSGPTAGGG